ncbi:MAG: quinone-dependent dihydroorotate dehydrogenase, partial [Gammaproteobacteria bacterium]|nr:quinone-dependent dihydroorotate dehydrogenase [Gammaproteobacteria bacterium]
HLSLQSISLLQQWNLTALVARDIPDDPLEVMGISFPNRVGLAAGLDKDASHIDGFASLGFGHLEVGTVTPRPQPGNPKPRLFRLKSRGAIINRMGFNNEGVDALTKKIRRSDYKGVLGVNIGKNFDTPMENALQDYLTCLRKVYKVASYIVVNISSPNTPGLRDLQQGSELLQLLEGLKEEHQRLGEKHEKSVPLLVKVAPDMTDEELRGVCDRLLQFDLDGIIVSNTTIDRETIQGDKLASEQGGLSGAPLFEKSNHALEVVVSTVKDKMAIIGVGGIMRGDDAVRKIVLGADLVQIYTGFIYQGPDLIRNSVDMIRKACPACPEP